MIAEILSRALCSQKSQTTTRPFRSSLEVGAADHCLKIEGKKKAHSTGIPRRRLRFTRSRSDSWEGLQQVHVSDAVSLAPERRAATELHNARLECDWSDGKTIVSKIRPHNAVY
jgi:hypothetical protein